MAEPIADVPVEALEQQLMSKVPEDGSSIGNTDMRRQLAAERWTDDQYWTIRDRLVDRGVIETGKGRGGSIHRVVLEGYADEPETALARHRIAERDLYAPMHNVISNTWARGRGISTSFAWITAAQGRRETGGKWSRPDITMVARRKFPYYPGVVYDVITFEIKPVDGIDLTAVYETVAHQRAATYSYVLVHLPEQDRTTLAEVLTKLADESRRHGVGLIVAEDPGDFSSWEELVEAERHDADPKAVSDYLKVQAQASLEVAEHIQEVFS